MSLSKKKRNPPQKRKAPEKAVVSFVSDSEAEEDDLFQGMQAAETAAAIAQQLREGKPRPLREWERSDSMQLSDEDDDSDEERMVTAEELQASLKAATAQVSGKLSRSQRKKVNAELRAQEQTTSSESGVVYIGHLPFGFFEQQMRVFFRQFGKILNLRISRNPKTGKSRHYAFIEFANRDVAEIVAENMNGYMMFGKTLVTRLLPPEEVHEKMFEGANKVYHPKKWRMVAREEHNRDRDEAAEQKRLKRIKRSTSRRKAELASLGIDYDLEKVPSGEVFEKGEDEAEVRGQEGGGMKRKSQRQKKKAEGAGKSKAESKASQDEEAEQPKEVAAKTPSKKRSGKKGSKQTKTTKTPPPTPAPAKTRRAGKASPSPKQNKKTPAKKKSRK